MKNIYHALLAMGIGLLSLTNLNAQKAKINFASAEVGYISNNKKIKTRIFGKATLETSLGNLGFRTAQIHYGPLNWNQYYSRNILHMTDKVSGIGPMVTYLQNFGSSHIIPGFYADGFAKKLDASWASVGSDGKITDIALYLQKKIGERFSIGMETEAQISPEKTSHYLELEGNYKLGKVNLFYRAETISELKKQVSTAVNHVFGVKVDLK
ncbi:hypothetical protein N9934_01800 [Desulfosarcina sp.]|nr:hypothetical protein [Desulfosarcina sp.]